jgi:hypothetical protein
MGLFRIEGVEVAARRCRDERRGLPRMKVPIPLIRKTSTCLTLPLVRVSAALT